MNHGLIILPYQWFNHIVQASFIYNGTTMFVPYDIVVIPWLVLSWNAYTGKIERSLEVKIDNIDILLK